MEQKIDFKILGPNAKESDFIKLTQTTDSRFSIKNNDIVAILSTPDEKIEFVFFKNHVLAYVKSAFGYAAYYPMHPVKVEKPIKAVLMDLDGTSVQSEEFWIWIIQLSTASLLGDPKFKLEEADLPYVSGHSVSEHLEYCIRKYCPDKKVEEARNYYFEHTHREMKEIAEGRGRASAFKPSPGLKDFLFALKARKIKIGLVTSGLYEKAWPEILSAFRTLEMGDPREFYDAIITAGFPMRQGEPGTLGELSPKPHPWLYAEVSRFGLGLSFQQRHHVVGIEDSSAGVSSIRLAGFSVIGYAHGNIVESGALNLCDFYCETFEEILKIID